MGEDEIEVEERLQVQTTEMTKEQEHHVLALLQHDQMPRQHPATTCRQCQSLKRKEEATWHVKFSLWAINWFYNIKINLNATSFARWGWLGLVQVDCLDSTLQ